MLVLTISVHNEVDLLDANLRFHYARGVDHVLAIDDRSTDGSSEVLQNHADAGRLTLVARPPGEMVGFASQSRWSTFLARLAKTQYGADWVLNGDVDEFWWPLHGSLTDALGRVGPDYGQVLIPRSDVVLLDEGSGAGSAAERLIVRECRSPIGLRVAHRGEADVVVSQGNHRVARNAHSDGLGWIELGEKDKVMNPAPVFPIRVFHYPVRSWESMFGAARDGRVEALNRDPLLRLMGQNMRGEDLRAMVEASGRHPPEPRRRLIDDLLSDGRFARDTRVRDSIASSTITPPRDSAEEVEVAGLVVWALAREDRRLRNRARGYQQEARDLRSSRWWQLKEQLTRPARLGRPEARD